MAQASFDELLDAVEHLAPDAQADLIEFVRHRLAKRGRQRVINDVHEARTEFETKQAPPTTVEDLMREIES